jgi:hypothetical protein
MVECQRKRGRVVLMVCRVGKIRKEKWQGVHSKRGRVVGRTSEEMKRGRVCKGRDEKW